MDKHQAKNYQQIHYDMVIDMQKNMQIPDSLVEDIPSDMVNWLSLALRHHNTFTMQEPIEVFEQIALKSPALYNMHEFVNACNCLSNTTAHQMGMTLTEWLAMRKKVGSMDATWQFYQNDIMKKADKHISDMMRSDKTRAELTGNKQIKL